MHSYYVHTSVRFRYGLRAYAGAGSAVRISHCRQSAGGVCVYHEMRLVESYSYARILPGPHRRD